MTSARLHLVTRLRAASRRDLLLVGIPALLLIIAAFWLASRFIQPAPPRTLVIATGTAGGGYQRYAAEYKQLLAREGVDLVERATSGSVENADLLRAGDGDVGAGFIQGGTVTPIEDDNLIALGALYYEPVWVFYRARLGDLDQIQQLRGKRLAIGKEGSGNRRIALDLLRVNGLGQGEVHFSEDSGLDGARALQRGKVDAIFVVGPPQSAVVWTLLYAKGVKLMSLSHADAYVRMFPHLSKLTLPRGSIDLVRDIPDREIQLVSPVAQLVVRDDTHPALVDLLIQAASEVHGKHGVFQRAGDFPRPLGVDFPLSPRADRFYKSGRPFFQRYMPFWAANLIDRTIVLLIPLLAVLFPVVKFAPTVYGWRVRSRIFKRYGELKFLEADVEAGSGDRAAWLERLDRIDHDVHRIPAPLAFSDMLYTLRSHIDLVRSAIERRTGAG